MKDYFEFEDILKLLNFVTIIYTSFGVFVFLF